MQRLLQAEEIADLVHLTLDEVLKLVKEGGLKAYSIAGQLRIGEEDFSQFLSRCVVYDPAKADTGTVPAPAKAVANDHDCATFGGQATFTYTGSVSDGAIIRPGKKTTYKIRVTSEQWASLLDAFRGKEVKAGLNFAHPAPESFGEWIKINWRTQMGPAAYVGGILIREGYAERPRPGWIRVFAEPREAFASVDPVLAMLGVGKDLVQVVTGDGPLITEQRQADAGRADMAWKRIMEHAGEMFQTVTGLPLRYTIDGNGIWFERDGKRINKRLSRSDVDRAVARCPLAKVTDISDCFDPSYLFALLMDDRIRQTDW